jgi:bis(5'-adenosyl)-triphosphatase
MDFGGNYIPEDHIIIKTTHSFAFTNLRPFLPLHILVSPKASKARLFELTTEETADLFNTTRLALVALRDRCEGYTVNIQDGRCAGQKVFHVHVHIVPRNYGDLERNEGIYAPGALDALDRPERAYDVMMQEAVMLRETFVKVFKLEDVAFE